MEVMVSGVIPIKTSAQIPIQRTDVFHFRINPIRMVNPHPEKIESMVACVSGGKRKVANKKITHQHYFHQAHSRRKHLRGTRIGTHSVRHLSHLFSRR